MSVLLKVNGNMWVNPSQIVYVHHISVDFENRECVHMWLGTDNKSPLTLSVEEWAAIEPLVTLPARAAGCTCGRENVTQKSLIVQAVDEAVKEDEDILMADYAKKQEQWHADLLAEDKARIYAPDSEKPADDDLEEDAPPVTDLYRLIKVVQSGNFVILDTETTGLNGDAEICQISIIDPDGNTILDTLVKPQKPIPSDATRIHGITNDMVKDAPSWEDVRPFVLGAMQERDVVVYNATYDRKMMHQSDRAADLMHTDYKESSDWFCAMLAYAEYRGVWNDYHGNYKWHKLSDAFDRVGGILSAGMKAHSALADCLMTLAVCKKLAGL